MAVPLKSSVITFCELYTWSRNVLVVGSTCPPTHNTFGNRSFAIAGKPRSILAWWGHYL